MSHQFKFDEKSGTWLDTFNEGDTVADYMAHLEFSATVAELVAMDGWCSCGEDPTEVLDLLTEYLRACETHQTLGGDLAHRLIAYRADELMLTEHGATIEYAWLTPAGKAWLKLQADPATNR